ncbi:MAG: hypothetical protein K6B14_01425 [Lachnospiraceae bacterium]|nr:hypothetical protein [Lachnospiraceae bacterium]
MNNDLKNLSQIRSLVMGNMPTTIVHTARMPVTKGLKKAIDKILLSSDSENDIIEEDVLIASARAFRDAEDDRAAAAALGVLFTEAKKRDDDTGHLVVNEVDEFLKRGRPVYLKVIIEQSGDHKYDQLYEGSLFIERCVKSGNTDLTLIYKQFESLATFKDTDIDASKPDESGRWFDLICNKLIARCESYLKDEKAGTKKAEVGDATDREHVIRIMEQTKKEKAAFEIVVKNLKDQGYGDDIVTWKDAIFEEVH